MYCGREDYHASEAAKHLAELQPGRQPYDLFRQTSRLLVTPVVELVALRQSSNGTEALLTKRPETDEFWPGKWHIPGSVMLGDDRVSAPDDYQAPLSRILDSELGGGLEILDGPHILCSYRGISARGSGLSIVHWVKVAGEPTSEGKFFEVNALSRNPPKEGVVEGHDSLVECATKAYDSLAATD